MGDLTIRVAAVAAALFGACGNAWAMGGNLATQGEALMKDQCAGCHAVGAEGGSKTVGAKPFRDIAMALPDDGFSSAFIDAVTKHHAAFKFDGTQFKSMTDYLDQLKMHIEKGGAAGGGH